MTQNSNSQNHSQSSQTEAELDLLKTLIEFNSPYPWEPNHPESDAFFNQLKNDWGESELTPAEVQTGYAAFSQTLATVSAESATLVARLQQFSTRVPQQILSSVAQQAESAVASNISLSAQLVQCVQEILPDWGIEDLTVLARPLAYAMRDTQSGMVEASLQAVPEGDWDALSQLDRAKLTLAIARYAIDQAQELDAQSNE